MIVGVIAVQGDFEKHQKVLNTLQIDNIPVRKPSQLAQCDALIIPGGESTTLIKLFKSNRLFKEIQKFAKTKAIMGTCAGLIVLAKQVHNPPLRTLQLMDIEATRNAYGRQIDSFVDDVTITLDDESINFEGVFIRAPKIKEIGQGVKAIGYHQKEPVVVENSRILVATFHPELTNDTRIHEYFIKKAENILLKHT
jgi:5'-phosphate synthase pdxT subunit